MPATGPAARRALVVLVDGELVWFSERGGRSLLNSADPEGAAGRGRRAGRAGRRRAGGRHPRRSSTVCRCWRPRRTRRSAGHRRCLIDAGFVRTPRGLRIR
jgi:ATP-dependent Lhr-like helicase